MIDVTDLVGTVFSGLSALVIEDVEDAGEVIRVRARSTGGEVACPGCGPDGARARVSRADGRGRAGRRPAGGGDRPTAQVPGAWCRAAGCRRSGSRSRAPLSAISGGLPGWRASARDPAGPAAQDDRARRLPRTGKIDNDRPRRPRREERTARTGTQR